MILYKLNFPRLFIIYIGWLLLVKKSQYRLWFKYDKRYADLYRKSLSSNFRHWLHIAITKKPSNDIQFIDAMRDEYVKQWKAKNNKRIIKSKFQIHSNNKKTSGGNSKRRKKSRAKKKNGKR